MNPHDMNPQQVREAAFQAILDALGPVFLARFISENGLGEGNYARDRKKWLPQEKPVREIVDEWRRGQAQGEEAR